MSEVKGKATSKKTAGSKSKAKSRKERSPEERAAAAEAAQERVDALKASIDNKLTHLAELIAAGKSEEFVEYLRFAARFHRYSWSNQVLIAWQAPEARFVAGFHAWKKMGRNVKKGGKSIKILAPKLVNDYDSPPQKDGKPAKKLIGFLGVSVFDDSQTEGDPLPEAPDFTVHGGGEAERELLGRLIEASPVPVRWEEGSGHSAHGWTDGKSVTLVREHCDAQPAHAVRAMAHEWAHVDLHFGADRKDYSREQRELEADSVAFIVCEHFGINAAEGVQIYLHGWCATPEALKASLGRIQRTAKAIIDAVSPTAESADADAEAESDAA